LKAPLGIVSFIVTATLASVSGVLIIAPFIYRFVDYELPWGAISTMSQALSLTAIGLGLGLFSLHIFNGLAAVFRWLSKSLLNSGQRLAVAE